MEGDQLDLPPTPGNPLSPPSPVAPPAAGPVDGGVEEAIGVEVKEEVMDQEDQVTPKIPISSSTPSRPEASSSGYTLTDSFSDSSLSEASYEERELSTTYLSQSTTSTSGVQTEPIVIGDPFLEDAWKDTWKPWTMVPEVLISTIVSPDIDIEAIKALCVCNFNDIKAKFATLPVIEGVELDPKYIRHNRLDTDDDQLALYLKDPSAPHPYPRTKSSLEGVAGDSPVPTFEYMPNIPVMLAKSVQECIRTTPVADGPGQSIKSPICRTLVYSSNPGYLSETIAPPIPREYLAELSDRQLTTVNENRMMEMQKLAWRNRHAEKHKYVFVPLPKFREMTFPRDFGPPGNLYPPEYYDALNPAAELATRAVVKNGAILGGGRESVIAVDIQTLKIPHNHSIHHTLRVAEIIRQLAPVSQPPETLAFNWSKETQARFAELAFSQEEIEHWNMGLHPDGLPIWPEEPALRYDSGLSRLDLNSYMSNILTAYEQLAWLRQDVSQDVAGNEYVCLIQLYSPGGPAVSIRVNYGTVLPPFLESLILNRRIKKLAVNTAQIRLAMYVSFKLPWDSEHGVYDLAYIMANTNLKPHVESGLMNMRDFTRLIQTFGFQAEQDPTPQDARDRLLNANMCMNPSVPMPQELLNFICLEAVLLYRLWFFYLLCDP